MASDEQTPEERLTDWLERWYDQTAGPGEAWTCSDLADDLVESDWLARVRAEAAAEALEEAADEYRSGQLTGVFYGRDDYTKAWLAKRAAELREKAGQ